MFGPITTLWNAYVDLISWCLHTLTEYTDSGGLSIIVFTIVLKTILLPLTVKSIRSTFAMQQLQPKIKELQKKYAKDRQELTQQTMRMYQEYRINPLAGCLPMLIQIPIFFGLYFAVRDLSRTAGDFMWIPNLAEADPWKILPIMAGVFQFIQTRMMRPHKAPKVTDPQQAMMNTMMNFMPIIVIVFGWSFASGAVLYWATQSVYSVIQQWFITGWGAMRDWFPWLWDMPEHRRLGYRKPAEPQAIDPAAEPKGLMGMMQKRVQAAEEERARRVAEANGGAAPASGSRSSGSSGKRARQTQARPAAVDGVNSAKPEEPPPGARTRVMTGRPKATPRRTRGNNGRTDA
ncbi:MAG TPA: YidC/Oxa1 family membrane protein insertase [Thermomicrobiales bacterium]|nr:YidC/Oxa1 family membrane protein insertase [Thermomicrobiales bacterium]